MKRPAYLFDSHSLFTLFQKEEGYSKITRGERALSYADSLATATARRINGIVVTGDPEFREVEDLVEIYWTR